MIEYEWAIEERTVYDDGGQFAYDIENSDYADKLEQYSQPQWDEIDGKNFVLTLIRRDWDHDLMNFDYEEAETSKGENGLWVLPKTLANSSGNETRDIPARFHRELAGRQKVKV